jgi:hypothetical protein
MGLFDFLTKSQYYVILLRKEYNAYIVEKSLKISSLKKFISNKENKYILNNQNPSYINRNKRYFCFDSENGAQLSFDGQKSLLNPTELDLIVGQKIIQELTSGVIDNKKDKIFTALIGAVLGALIVGMILVMYYSEKIETIYKESNENTIIIPSLFILRNLMKMF